MAQEPFPDLDFPVVNTRTESRLPALRGWAARASAVGLSLLTAGAVGGLVFWPDLVLSIGDQEGLSLVQVVSSLLYSPIEWPATMRSIAFGSAWGVSAAGAVIGWLVVSIQAMRGRTDRSHRVAVVLTVVFLLMGFVFATAWPYVAPWVPHVAAEGPGRAISMDAFGWGSLVVVVVQTAAGISLGTRPLRMSSVLVPVLSVGLAASLFSAGRGLPQGRVVAESVGSEPYVVILAGVWLAVICAFIVFAAISHGLRYGTTLLWEKLAASFALSAIVLTTVLMVAINMSYLLDGDSRGLPLTPHPLVNAPEAITAAVALVALIVPERRGHIGAAPVTEGQI